MAKVKITGHASGSGVITVTAPNTSTDRTITLPDTTATIATTADVTAATFNPNAAQVFNESGADVDFRVESDTKTHALFVDGALGRTGINKATPEARLDIVAAGETGLRVVAATSGEYAGIFQSANTNSTPIVDFRDSGGNSKFKALADGRALSQFTAKAWIKFDGNGTSVDDSHNVASLSDFGTGNYGINFSNSLANAHYCVQANTSNNKIASVNTSNTVQTTGRCDIEVNTIGGAAHDSAEVYALFFGD